MYGLVGFNYLLFAMINSWKVHPQSTIFSQVSFMKLLTFSRSSKSWLHVRREGKKKNKKKNKKNGLLTYQRKKWERIPYDLVLEKSPLNPQKGFTTTCPFEAIKGGSKGEKKRENY
jgi:hypothetical protein